MGTCELCKRSEDGLSLREASHRDLGKKWICGDCWTNLYEKNKMISGTTGGGSISCGRGCAGCRLA